GVATSRDARTESERVPVTDRAPAIPGARRRLQALLHRMRLRSADRPRARNPGQRTPPRIRATGRWFAGPRRAPTPKPESWHRSRLATYPAATRVRRDGWTG